MNINSAIGRRKLAEQSLNQQRTFVVPNENPYDHNEGQTTLIHNTEFEEEDDSPEFHSDYRQPSVDQPRRDLHDNNYPDRREIPRPRPQTYKQNIPNNSFQNQQSQDYNKMKKGFELLSEIGRLFKEINVGNSVFLLRTLKAGEKKQIYKLLQQHNGTELLKTIYLMQITLAYSLIKIDNVQVNDYFAETFEQKCMLIDELDEFTFQKLYASYLELEKEATKNVNLFNNASEEDLKG